MIVEWVQKDGEVFFDSRVTDQETAANLYGEGAKFRPNGDKYTSSDKSSIELMDGGQFSENGEIKNNGDRAQAFTSTAPNIPGTVGPQLLEEMARTDGDRHETLQVGVGPISVVSNMNTVDGRPVGELYNGVGLNLSFPKFGISYTNYRGHVDSGLFLNGQICVGECLSVQTDVRRPISTFAIDPGMGSPQAGVGLNVVWKDNRNKFRPDRFDPITQQALKRWHPGMPR